MIEDFLGVRKRMDVSAPALPSQTLYQGRTNRRSQCREHRLCIQLAAGATYVPGATDGAKRMLIWRYSISQSDQPTAGLPGIVIAISVRCFRGCRPVMWMWGVRLVFCLIPTLGLPDLAGNVLSCRGGTWGWCMMVQRETRADWGIIMLPAAGRDKR